MDKPNYPKTHPEFNENNKAKLGFFKDELCGKKLCTLFIGLRAKCYSLNLVDKETNEKSEKLTCKGLGRMAIRNRLKAEQYKKCLEERKVVRHEFNSIRSQKHSVSTVRIRKKALSHFDSKRWIFNCGIHSCPYGSKYIAKYYDMCPVC